MTITLHRQIPIEEYLNATNTNNKKYYRKAIGDNCQLL